MKRFLKIVVAMVLILPLAFVVWRAV